MIDLGRFLNGEIASVAGFVKTFVAGRKVDDAVEAAVEFENGSVGTIEGTRLALGRRNAFQWEINGSKGSLAFDMERLNELQVFRADGDRARGFKTVLVSETDHPFWEHWWPPGHIIGWGDTFVHELHHMLKAIADDTDVAPYGATFEDGYRASEVADAIVRSGETGERVRVAYRTLLALGEHEGRLAAAVRERILEPVERHAQADELLELVGPALADPVEVCDRGEPILAGCVDASEENAILEHGVERRACGPGARPAVRAGRCPSRHATPLRRRRPSESAISCALPAASTTRSKPPSSASGSLRKLHVLRAGRGDQVVRGLERRRPHLEPGESEQIGRERPDGARAEDERALRAATAGDSPIVRTCRSARSQTEVGSASTPSRPSERGIGTSCAGSSTTSSQAKPFRRVIPRST